MADTTPHSPEQLGEARLLADRLIRSVGVDRREAASQLSALGVRTRGSIRTRGRPRVAAEPRLPDAGMLRQIADSLQDRDPSVRARVALALGEWGGDDAAGALGALLATERDETVRLHIITALRTIGGGHALDALAEALRAGRSEAERDAALKAIEELITGGQVDDTEPAPGLAPAAPPTVRTRGPARIEPIRTRGREPRRQPAAPSPSADARDPLRQIASTLRGVSDDARVSEYLRLRADEVLRSLGG